MLLCLIVVTYVHDLTDETNINVADGVGVDAAAQDIVVPEFNMSQELNDYMMEEEVEENIGQQCPQHVDDWYDDDNSIPSDDKYNDDLFNNTDSHGGMKEEDASFKVAYAKSIGHVITMVEELFKRSMWSGLHVATHPPASNSEINDLLQVL